MEHKLDTLEKIQLFLVNKNSEFIVKNISNNHTIRFNIKLKKEINNNKHKFYIYKDNKYIGNLYKENIISESENKITYICKISDDDVFEKLINFIYVLNKIPNNIEIYHTGKCSLCGRKLVKLKYIEIGIGEKCLKSLKSL